MTQLNTEKTEASKKNLSPCKIHEDHDHVHGPNCGHKAIRHGDHTDYFHDGHYHRVHGDHVDECSGPQ